MYNNIKIPYNSRKLKEVLLHGIFNKISEKASTAYKVTAAKTGKLAKEAKLKLKMSNLKSQINDIYLDIGAKIYEKHLLKEDINIKNDLEEECTKIDILTNQIEEILNECLELNNKKQCLKCFAKIDKDCKFCPECGTKQEDTSNIDKITPIEKEL
jgi:NADH pyrophosphatase NudC (nudix superfamily)